MRFAAKRTFSRFAYKAELTLNRLFNMGSLHSLQSRDKRAGNRGEKTPLGCELTLSQSFKHGRSHNLHSRDVGVRSGLQKKSISSPVK